ncbi:MAG: DUF6325 family protein [Actinomycetes bacterium]
MTQVGPVEVMVIAFPGSQFNGSVAPSIQEVVARGDIAIVDMAFITKALNGEVTIVEAEEVDTEALGNFDALAGDLLDLLNDDDLAAIGADLDPGSSALAIVFEHKWARGVAAAVAGSNGFVVFDERVPREIVLAAIAATS